MFPILTEVEMNESLLILAGIFLLLSHIVTYAIAHLRGVNKGVVAQIESFNPQTQTIMVREK